MLDIEKKFTDLDYDKYITTSEFNDLTGKSFAARLAQANFVAKTDFDTKLICLNKKINSNKTKHVLVENKLEKLKTFDSSYFRAKSHFEEDGVQNCFIFQTINFWKSKGLSDEKINSITASNYSITPELGYSGNKIRVKFMEVV